MALPRWYIYKNGQKSQVLRAFPPQHLLLLHALGSLFPSSHTPKGTKRALQTQGYMAKEEDVKKIELKVSVNCCDGCRKKVLKALSVKGVLKAAIHPTLPKVTVLGNADHRTLVKRLARRGKTAELWPAEPAKQDKGENKSESVEKEAVAAICNEICGKEVRDSGDGAKPKPEDNKEGGNPANGDCDKGEKKGAPKDAEICNGGAGNGSPTEDFAKNTNPTCAAATMPTAVTAPPPGLDYGVVNPPRTVVLGHGDARVPYGSVYHTMQPYPVPAVTNYYATNAYAARDQHYTSPPAYNYHHQVKVPPMSLPSQLGDYFSDENAVGKSAKPRMVDRIRRLSTREDSRPHLKVESDVPHQVLAARQARLQFLSARPRTRMRPTWLPELSEESMRLTKQCFMRLGPLYSSDSSSLVTPSNKSLQLSTSGYQSSGHADLELGVLACPVTVLTGSTDE
ncbi:hypothetical protein Taro_012381 [Colocasia esculenta]|uniref:HMA domain-containing protein n=1 Tax=Colocasia esculenta TaxID=4460 RepID=A0A843U8N0_COLES|nr:hypothetical protein [Colocasia esculenta]